MTDRSLNELANKMKSFVASDNRFQRRARILQAMWREAMGYDIGPRHDGSPDEILGPDDELGSRLPVKWAEETLANYLTNNIRNVVREELDAAKHAASEHDEKGKVFKRPRIFNDLLSSQPLCFNLFAELKVDMELATSVFRTMMPDRIEKVTKILFEHSPGRGKVEYLGDGSAFDVFVEYDAVDGSAGFVGIEVKYHENLSEQPAKHKYRYTEVATFMGCFHTAQMSHLREKPLQQIWRDHLLGGSMLVRGEYKCGSFVFMYPAGNTCCREAVRDYRDCLSDSSTFDAWTLEEFVSVLSQHTDGAWVSELRKRYLGFERLQGAMTR